MPSLIIIDKDGSKKQINAESGWSLMEILRDEGYQDIEGVCGGSMACATCHLYIHPTWTQRVEAQNNVKTEEEDDILDMAFDIRETSRLGCQIRLSDELDGLIVAIPGAKTDW